MALAVLLAGCGQAGGSVPSSLLSADSVAFDSTDVGSTSVEIVARSAGLLLDASSNTAFESWGSQDPVAVMESERFESLVDIKRRSSAVVVARLGAELEPHVVEGDAGTGDVVSFARYELTVVEALAGTRTVEPGQELVLEFAIGFPPPAHEQVVILFLRFMRDGFDGRPNPEWVSLPETWRLVNSQGVFVDSGDGRPVNPIAVVRAWEGQGGVVALEEFVVSGYDPSLSSDPVERETAEMTTVDLLDFLRTD